MRGIVLKPRRLIPDVWFNPLHWQALSYRAGHHSTSDDSTKYRPVEEIEWWRTAQDPVTRLRKWIQSNGWWSDENESELRSNARKQVKLVLASKIELLKLSY